MILTPPNELADEWHWQSIDDKTILRAKPDNVKRELLSCHDLCLTGEVNKTLASLTGLMLAQWFNG